MNSADTRGLSEGGIFMALDRPQPVVGRVVTTIPPTNAPTAPLRPSSQVTAFPRSAAPVRSESSERAARAWRMCSDLLVRTGRLLYRYRYELAPLGATTGFTGGGWWLYADGIPWWGTAISAALGAISGWAGYLGMKHKHPHVAHVGGGLVLLFGDLTAGAAAGPGSVSLIADGIFTATAYAVYSPWLTARRHERMKLHVDTVKAKGAVPAAIGVEMADPGLVGSSTEETALRRAIYALVGATPLDVPAFQFNDNGWSALVTMPAGKNTSPDAIIRKKDQLSSNLGLPGTLHLTKGDNNQLLVRLVTSDALAGTIPYEDDGFTSMADPVRLGLDEHGQPVSISMLYRHTLFAGASDWGKSGLVNLVIKRMARRADVDIYGIDMKPGAVELGPWAPLLKGLAKNVYEARELFDFLEAEGERRGKILADLSAQNLANGLEPVRKWIPGVHGNGILFVIDELAELIRQDEELRRQEAEWRKSDPESYPLQTPLSVRYESGLALWRFLAISAAAATQQPSRKVFGGSTDARGNYANRISTRMGEAGHAPFIFGQGCQSKGWRPELLDLPGKFLVASPEPANSEPRVCRAEYVSDADIAADVSHLYARNAARASMAMPVDAVPVPKPAPVLLYPDGTPVGKDGQPDLWRVFKQLGSATKKELQQQGPFDSLDTVGRAVEVWEQHGVMKRKEGRAERFFLPEMEEEAA